jgi:hypothetical protein
MTLLTLIAMLAGIASPIAECEFSRPTWCLEKSAVTIKEVAGRWQISASYLDGKPIIISESGMCDAPARGAPVIAADRLQQSDHGNRIEEITVLAKTSGKCRITISIPNSLPKHKSLHKSVALTSIRICRDTKCSGKRLAAFFDGNRNPEKN